MFPTERETEREGSKRERARGGGGVANEVWAKYGGLGEGARALPWKARENSVASSRILFSSSRHA